MTYDVKRNPDGTVVINGYTFPAGTVPDFRSARSSGRADGLSAQQARTIRRNAMIDGGRHPFGRQLREPRGETCSTCVHVVSRTWSRTHHKCGLMRDQWTKGPGTDLRLGWPACVAWERNPKFPEPPPQPDPLAPVLEVENDPGLSPALGGVKAALPAAPVPDKETTHG